MGPLPLPLVGGGREDPTTNRPPHRRRGSLSDGGYPALCVPTWLSTLSNKHSLGALPIGGFRLRGLPSRGRAIPWQGVSMLR